MSDLLTFTGTITGVGTRSGTRIVVGDWEDSPWGTFTDVMVERFDGRRILLAPSYEVADFVASTYSFDEIRVEDIWTARTGASTHLGSRSLDLRIDIGRRTALGYLLRAVPRRVGTTRWWARAIDPVARLAGVRTYGSAGSGRTEWYAAHDLRAIVALSATWEGADLGTLAPVDPAVRFGFGSTPRCPSAVEVTTSVSTADVPPRAV